MYMCMCIYATVCSTCVCMQQYVHFVVVRYEDEVYSEWTEEVDDVAKANLDKPLLIRDPSSQHISVNFAPQVRMWL